MKLVRRPLPVALGAALGAEVPAADLPLVVLLHRTMPTSRKTLASFLKMPTPSVLRWIAFAPPFHLLVRPFRRVGRSHLPPVSLREREVSEHLRLGVIHETAARAFDLAASHVTHCFSSAASPSGTGVARSSMSATNGPRGC